MPDILINPLGTRFLGVLGRVDSCLLETLLEDGVLKTKVTSSMLMVERIISSEYIVVAPAERPGICCEHTGVKPIVKSALEHGEAELVVGTLVELEEARSRAIGLGNVFDAVTSGRRQAVREVELFGYFGHGQLASGMVDAVDANGSESNGSRHLVAENLGGSVSLIGVDEHARDDSVSVESLSV